MLSELTTLSEGSHPLLIGLYSHHSRKVGVGVGVRGGGGGGGGGGGVCVIIWNNLLSSQSSCRDMSRQADHTMSVIDIACMFINDKHLLFTAHEQF